MPTLNECFLCHKQKNLPKFVGGLIAERGGLILTHFPFLAEEKATKGHLIIEPRRHIEDLSEMNAPEAAALGGLMKDSVTAIKILLQAEHVYVFRINDKLAHLHFHLVPRYPDTPREFWGAKIMDWPNRQTVTLAQIQNLSSQIKAFF